MNVHKTMDEKGETPGVTEKTYPIHVLAPFPNSLNHATSSKHHGYIGRHHRKKKNSRKLEELKIFEAFVVFREFMLICYYLLV